MVGFRGLRILVRSALGVLLAVPLASIGVAAIFDRGPSGETRFAAHILPLVLWIYDDFAWTCARNSVVFAVVVTVASLALGMIMGWAGARRRFWGRMLGRGLVISILAVTPAFMALGLLDLIGSVQSGALSGHAAAPALPTWAGATGRGMSLESWSGLSLWGLWVWTTLPAAVAIVTAMTLPAVERLRPSWDDAARLAGGSTFTAWRRLIWPLLRPAAARGGGLVFLFSLLEPGAPRVLGLRRTLAFQVVELAARAEPFPRLAVWALMAVLIALAGSLMVRWWGGTPHLGGDGLVGAGLVPRPATRVGAAFSGLLLGCWGALSWLPIVGIVNLSLGEGWRQSKSGSAAATLLATLARCFGDAPVPDVVAASALLGLEVAAGLAALRWLAGPAGAAGPRSAHPSGLKLWYRLVAAPPLAVGVGAFALPWLATLAARYLDDEGRLHYLARALEGLADSLDPDQGARALVTMGVGLALAPWLLRLAPNGGSSRPRHGGGSAAQAALLAGASSRTAWRMAAPSNRARWLGWLFVVWAVAATNVAPALLWSPWSEGRTISSAAVALAGGPAEERCQAAALALGAISIMLAALVVARAIAPRACCDDLE